ncbi:EmrB/QacA subfamily drug resistance transporter [Mycolicibacterium sp. BK634]|uniref:MFS transporter n=1 Tax=Mycolicibacterium sp. BK634 TaxID=2587099 RepID=UPI0016084E9C|nr:MFS transporter [Mycolicibacterium sp. BK634]MBB3754185.1 EmrB/QacA subfamily drug resistance transporter [Mycolicibacterium sp. BK634]
MAPQRSSTLTLVAAYLGLVLGLIDSNAVNLALPAISTHLGGGLTAAQWTVDAYNMTFAALLLGAGTLGDAFGRRRLLRIGVVVFVAASLCCALAPSLPVLLAGRAVQGAAAALMLPQGLAIAAAAFPDAPGRARATAAWAIAAASSTALGPILGGVLTQSVSWRAIFWLNVPVGVVALAISYRYLPESSDPRRPRLDIGSQLLAATGLAALTLALVQGRHLGAAPTAALVVVTVACITTFVVRQRRIAQPMVPPELVRHRSLRAGLVATFAMTFGTYGLVLINSLAFQQLRGATPLTTALQFLPLPMTYLALIPVVNVVARRTGPRVAIAAGLTALAAALTIYGAAGPTAPLGWIEAALVLAGAGLAVTTGPAVSVALSSVPSQNTGLGSGLVNLSRLTGITVGTAALGSLYASGGGARAAMAVGAAVLLIGGVLSVRWGMPEEAASDPAVEKEASHA